ncbi:hypothetical protein C8Q75DRAFT_412533 [Abortiporus biennis]|nr:hypothetical protein C8Q75DRAFT_412533 [Abortiporus biennis]
MQWCSCVLMFITQLHGSLRRMSLMKQPLFNFYRVMTAGLRMSQPFDWLLDHFCSSLSEDEGSCRRREAGFECIVVTLWIGRLPIRFELSRTNHDYHDGLFMILLL